MAAIGQVILIEALLTEEAKDREFEAAVREHARYVYRVAQAVLRNHHDAEDAVQETFLRFLRQERELVWDSQPAGVAGARRGAWLWIADAR